MNSIINTRKNPRQSRSKDTVNVILEASTHILLRDGYGQFNTNKIAERAGVSIGSLYQYFPNKKALIVVLWQRNADALREKLISVFEESIDLSLKEALEKIVKVTCDAHLESPKLQILIEKLFRKEVSYEDQHKLKHEIHLKIYPLAIQFLSRYKADYREGLDLDKALSLISRLVGAMMDENIMLNEDEAENVDFVKEQAQIIEAYLTK